MNWATAVLITLCRSLERIVCIFDDETGSEAGDGHGQARLFDRAEHFREILVGGGRFVFWIAAAVGEMSQAVKASSIVFWSNSRIDALRPFARPAPWLTL